MITATKRWIHMINDKNVIFSCYFVCTCICQTTHGWLIVWTDRLTWVPLQGIIMVHRSMRINWTVGREKRENFILKCTIMNQFYSFNKNDQNSNKLQTDVVLLFVLLLQLRARLHRSTINTAVKIERDISPMFMNSV